ncbi:hypothetical protein ABZ917_36810 [Nonomuraea wenchangensis]
MNEDPGVVAADRPQRADAGQQLDRRDGIGLAEGLPEQVGEVALFRVQRVGRR